MAHHYTFRVDEVEGVTRHSIISFLSATVGAHCVCYEISDKTKKPHYQGWVYTDLSEQVMKNRIKAYWPSVKGTTRGRSSGKYSCAPVRKESYQSYCLKGTSTDMPDVVSMQLRIGEELDIPAIHRQYWSRETSTVPKNMHIVDEGIQFYSNYAWGDEDVYERRSIVAKFMIDKLIQSDKKSFDTYRTRTFVNAVCVRSDPEFAQVFHAEVVNKI